jgi:hypothetical protein
MQRGFVRAFQSTFGDTLIKQGDGARVVFLAEVVGADVDQCSSGSGFLCSAFTSGQYFLIRSGLAACLRAQLGVARALRTGTEQVGGVALVEDCQRFGRQVGL